MASPVLSVQKHTLTIGTTSTSPTDVTFIVDTPPNVQLTKGAGTNLPSMVVGECFSIANHTTHDGVYEVVTVNTDAEDYLVASISGVTDAATGEAADVNQNVSDLASLTGSPDITNCIPFVTTRVSTAASTPDYSSAYLVRADFVDDATDKVRVRTSDRLATSRVIVSEVTVVEFNPAEVNVYQGEGQINGTTSVVLNDPYGASVDVVLAKSWLYFTYTNDVGNDQWRNHAIRGVMTDVDTLTFDSSQAQGGDGESAWIKWYVAEAINTAWSVDQVAIQIADAASTNTGTITAVGDTAKTFVLGSYKCAGTNVDSCVQNTIDVELTNSTTVTSTRLSGAAGNGALDWNGFVVELAAGNVYRGQVSTTNASPDPAGHTTITSVTAADSMVHTCGLIGTLGGPGNDDDNSNDVPRCFYAWTFFSDTQIDCEHLGGTTFESADVTWEVIEWDVGGAAPAARRVMVIS